jgi:hypothetical protein
MAGREGKLIRDQTGVNETLNRQQRDIAITSRCFYTPNVSSWSVAALGGNALSREIDARAHDSRSTNVIHVLATKQKLHEVRGQANTIGQTLIYNIKEYP